MAEARDCSSLFLSIGSSFSVSVAVFARLPEISVRFHYAPFGGPFSTDVYVAMLYVSRAALTDWEARRGCSGVYRRLLPGPCRQAEVRLALCLRVPEIPGVPVGSCAELLLWTAPHFLLQLGTGMECLLYQVHQSYRLEALESFPLYSCSCSWLLCSSCEVVGKDDFLLLPWCVLDSRTI